MLTQKQQRLMIVLLYKDVSRKRNHLYGSRSYYKTIGYLESNNLIKKVPVGYHSYVPELTLKGRFLARILAGFIEVEKNIREKYGAS